MDMKKILGLIEEGTGLKPQAFAIDSVKDLPAMSYRIYRTSDNGSKSQWRLECRITAKTLASLLELEERLKDSLVTVADTVKCGCSIAVNGGGTLLDANTGYPQQITYFDLTTRS